MFYFLLKSIHIVAAILWIGSLFAVTFIASKVELSHEQLRVAVRITDTAIGITWLMGGVLTVMGGWYASSWWILKVILVVLISAMHTFVHRRWKNNSDLSNISTYRFVPQIILSSALLVVFLVVSKYRF